MTEAEWQESDDPEEMLLAVRDGNGGWLSRVASRINSAFTWSYHRKLRLYMCGCCRFSWDVLSDEVKRTIEHVELRESGVNFVPMGGGETVPLKPYLCIS